MAAASSVAAAAEPVLDIHQHTHYHGRSDEDLVAHQRAMGVTMTVLLPAGSRGGLAANAHGNDSVQALARRYPKEFVYFTNEVPDISEGPAVIR
ncbi:MAG TPA: amidohydrolase, partial [Bryobacteraceae bacterium]|nr:amidohydrolase [Bryobacteraceae bacterium]